jgi:hypothetical protein
VLCIDSIIVFNVYSGPSYHIDNTFYLNQLIKYTRVYLQQLKDFVSLHRISSVENIKSSQR